MPSFGVTRIAATSPAPAGARLKAGDTLTFTLTPSQTVTSVTAGPGGATPTLALSNGAVATYTGSDAGGLHFAYTVRAGQNPAQDTDDLLVTGLSLNGATIAHAASQGFAAGTATNATGFAPILADLDNDGRLDLLSVTTGANTINVQHGNGDGTFAAATTAAVGASPAAIAVGDLDEDGARDVIVANGGGNSISVLRGDGRGGLAAQSTVQVGTNPQALAVADLNRDGHLDVVVANKGSNTVSILLGNGHGGLALQSATYAVGAAPSALIAQDVNGDGVIDVVTANATAGTLSVLLGDGRGGFGAASTYAVGRNPIAIAAADVNGDGRIDLIATNAGSNTTSILLGQAAGGFAAQTTFAVRTDGSDGYRADALSVTDIDGDGKLDLVTQVSGTFYYNVDNGFSSYSAARVAIRLGDGAGNFGPVVDYASVGYFAGTPGLAVGDLNGDGRPDIIQSSMYGDTTFLNAWSATATLDPGTVATATGRDTGIAVDATAPSATSLRIAYGGSPTATSLTATVVFSEAVAGVDLTDFTLATSGTASARIASVTPVGSGGTTYAITLEQVTGRGDVHLDLNASGTGIADAAGNAIAAGFRGSTFQFGNTAPTFSGPTTLAVRDDRTITPFASQFSSATITDVDTPAQTLAVTVHVDADRGSFSAASLTATGFHAAAAGNYTFSGSAADATTALRGLVFVPTPNRLPPGQSQATFFPVSIDDGVGGTYSGNSTYVVVSSVNDAPSAADVRDALSQRTSLTGALVLTDPDVGDSASVQSIALAGATLTAAAAHDTTTATVADATSVATASSLTATGTFGTLSLRTDGTYSYAATAEGGLAVGQTGTDDFVATLVDTYGATATTHLRFVVTGSGQGDAGNNIIVAGPGNNVLNGGAGDDTAVLPFALTQARLGYDAAGHPILDGPNGAHAVLSDFEHYRFSDGTVNQHAGSALVDDLFYYTHNNEAWTAHRDATADYNGSGWRAGLDPSAYFSTSGYLAANADVRAAGVNPLSHYDAYGWHEGRDPSAAFDNELYLARNPDVAQAGIDPLAHYLVNGQSEGRQAYAAIGRGGDISAAHGFDAEYYLLNNPDVARAAISAGGDSFAFAAQHYQTFGWHEGRNPNAVFDTAGYLNAYADVRAANIDPLAHYDTNGWREGRDPSANFDTRAYEAHYTDVAAAGIDPMTHYLAFGIYEGRSAFADGHFG